MSNISSIGKLEEWRDIPGCQGYQVSSFGGVRSIDRYIHPKGRKAYFLRGKTLKFDKKINNAGYFTVSVGRVRDGAVHRLVAITFLGKPPTCHHQVNHINHNKLDNRLENLEWVTPKENIRKAKELGKFIDRDKKTGNLSRGVLNIKAKLTETKVISIYWLKKNKLMKTGQIAKLFNITPQTITSILNKKTWIHLLKDL